MRKIVRRIRPYPASLRRGFSFTEVLFAVMVLGIGFIMIAAMFPVTIQQTQSTLQESVGASIARGAIAYLQTQATEQNFPATTPPNGAGWFPAQVVSMQDPVGPVASNTVLGWYATRGNYINPINPRFAWIPLYMRSRTSTGELSPFAQVFVIAVQCRNRPQYFDQFLGATAAETYSDIIPRPTFQSTLEPRPITVDLSYNAGGVMTVYLNPTIAAPGAYVIIKDDRNAPAPGKLLGQSNGRIYRLGNMISEVPGTSSTWQLAPDGDMIRSNASPTNTSPPAVTGDDNDLSHTLTNAYIVGRGYHDPADPSQGYSGPAQDIAVYTGFIRINPPVTP